jgi:hypothetical protein
MIDVSTGSMYMGLSVVDVQVVRGSGEDVVRRGDRHGGR